MIFALLILSVIAVSANPYHKYPYVFLLDVGNEELEKVNTEQIKLSSPGGTVALRYPAIGDGNDIAHVRVSSLDFGTDLKANLVDGGPGYKYVVVVLMGNPDVAYDAVITLQTLPKVVNDGTIQTIDKSYSGTVEDNPETYQVSEDQNNSAEDLDEFNESELNQVAPSDKNGELTQESADVYSYAQSEEANHGNDEESKFRDDSNEENNSVYRLYNENIDQSGTVEVEDYDPDEDTAQINEPLKYTADDDYSQSDDNKPLVVDQNIYDKYEESKDHMYDDSEVYPQENIEEPDVPPSLNQNYDDRPEDIGEMYDDYEENALEKYRDTNNNFIKSDELSAVEQ